MNVDSYVMYGSFYESIKDLDDDVRLKIYDSINEYALYHREININDKRVNSYMTLIKPQLDANYKRRKASIENGKKGGRPKKTQSSEELEDKVLLMEDKNLNKNLEKPIGYELVKPKQNLNVNVNVNDNVNVNYIKGSVEFKKVFSEFVEMRKKIKKPMTDKAKSMLVNKLNELSSDEDEKIKILEQSILNCWQSVYPLKEDKIDSLPKYDSTSNKTLSDDELNELLSLRRS